MTNIITITNNRTGNCLGRNIAVAASFRQRFIGLLGRSSLKEEEGLLIEKCNQVHMLFMRFEIGIIFLSPDLKIVGIRKSLKPWQISSRIAEAAQVLELPVGVIESTNCQVGDKLVVI